MSFDLLVLATRGLDAAAVRERIASAMDDVESADDTPPASPDRDLAAFLAEITRLHPTYEQLSDLSPGGDADQVPWSVSPVIDSPDWIYLCVSWSRAEEMSAAVQRVAAANGLSVYDPQSDVVVHHAAERPPVLRATTERGTTIEDPSEDGFLLLFEEIEQGRSGYLIVDSLTDETGHTYAQTSRNTNGSYVVEHRAGSPERHFGTTEPDMRSAHALITGWAFDVDGWRESAEWARIEF